ncbi:MAG TPA: sulfatase [Planctomycetota bacterium]|nr:sulfatase [Planctomycetota bacterium]
MRLVLVGVLLLASCAGEPRRPSPGPPNIVILLTDDQGYADLGCFGAKDIRTPNLDRMAREGMRFTDFYVAQAVCTASRAALMTGCYPNRVGLQGALNHQSAIGISDDEVLLPQLCKSRGYATAAFGKWHLGCQPKFLPTRHGFDEFFGIPYSNDNGPLHPTMKGLPSLPLYEGEAVIDHDPDQRAFTRWITEHATSFIRRNRERPFFLYVPHIMPHVPIHASDAFRGKSARGLYGDVIEELDWSVGEILAALASNGVDDRTMVFYFSDNGPFLSYGTHAGRAEPLREGKLTAWDGGMRSPCLLRWPGRTPPGAVCPEPVMSLDLLPTFAGLIGVTPPKNAIDGLDILPILEGRPGAASPHEALYFYAGEELQAVRSGDWKLHFAHEYLTPAGPPRSDGKPANFEHMKPEGMDVSGIRGIASRHGYRVEKTAAALYDVRRDPGETKDVSAEHPDLVRRLEALAEKARAVLGDALTGRKGSGVRPPGRL